MRLCSLTSASCLVHQIVTRHISWPQCPWNNPFSVWCLLECTYNNFFYFSFLSWWMSYLSLTLTSWAKLCAWAEYPIEIKLDEQGRSHLASDWGGFPLHSQGLREAVCLLWCGSVSPPQENDFAVSPQHFAFYVSI